VVEVAAEVVAEVAAGIAPPAAGEVCAGLAEFTPAGAAVVIIDSVFPPLSVESSSELLLESFFCGRPLTDT